MQTPTHQHIKFRTIHFAVEFSSNVVHGFIDAHEAGHSSMRQTWCLWTNVFIYSIDPVRDFVAEYYLNEIVCFEEFCDGS
ncbi:hypothetical protein AYI68_g2199 [Smittium mucronatum]|uniref:Uncharacterized protein n=1 Tax=Smittium mucronatum TaxID=133383 RepID=A0A1R0H3E5_9FUNG|nr:hypothetical protein AYI68_g2199 [Smittium mucronatum]